MTSFCGRISVSRNQVLFLVAMAMCLVLEVPQTVKLNEILSFYGTEDTSPSFDAPSNDDDARVESNDDDDDAQSLSTAHSNDQSGNGDWFDRQVWESHNITKDKCFSLEGVCHHGMEWFYDGSLHENVSAYQPMPFNITDKADSILHGYFHRRIKMDSRLQDVSAANCQYSPIPHHLVLHGFYSVMMGEFFARAFAGLSEIYHNVLETDKQRNLFVDTTQLYLHINKGRRHLLEGHEMFLSLFSRHRPSTYADLLDSSHIMHCQCFKRLTFCGYNGAAGSEKGSLSLSNQGAIAKTPDYHKLQQLIYQKFVANNPEVQANLNAWRKDILKRAENQDSWTIVGLAQRKGRRRWLNMADTKRVCDQWGLRQKVKCVEVNVEREKMANPYHHVLAHASLDALIGVHGAQLTDGVLMKPGSVVVELLPFIPSKKGSWGLWTNTAHEPTPLGVIFHNTDLNHIGVPLTIDSLPSNSCVTNWTQDCFQERENHWSNRDFQFNGKAVIDVLERLVVPMTKKRDQWKRVQESTTGIKSVYDLKPEAQACTDLMERAGDDYVLYNVHCVDEENGGNSTVHHFYRDKKWLFNKTVPIPVKIVY